jgi:hypothetical protein
MHVEVRMPRIFAACLFAAGVGTDASSGFMVSRKIDIEVSSGVVVARMTISANAFVVL